MKLTKVQGLVGIYEDEFGCQWFKRFDSRLELLFKPVEWCE